MPESRSRAQAGSRKNRVPHAAGPGGGLLRMIRRQMKRHSLTHRQSAIASGMSEWRACVTAFVVALCMLNPQANAGIYRLLPTANGSINSATPNQPDLEIHAENKNNQSYSKAYLQFDVTWLTGSVAGARLVLTTSNWDQGSSPHYFSVYGINNNFGSNSLNWIEGGLTWNNAPANDPTGGGFLNSEASFLGNWTNSDSISNLAFIPISFTSAALSRFLATNASGLVTFAINSETPSTADTSWCNRFVIGQPQNLPFLEIQTDSENGLDQTAGYTLVATRGAQQRVRGFGAGLTNPSWQLFSASQAATVATELWSATHFNVIRLWVDGNELKPTANAPLNLSGFLSRYVTCGLISNALSAGVSTVQLSVRFLPNWVLGAADSTNEFGVTPFADTQIGPYAQLLAQTVNALRTTNGVPIRFVGIANECNQINVPQWPLLVKAVRADLDSYGLNDVGILAPEWANNDGSALERIAAIRSNPEAWAALAGVATHDVNSPAVENLYLSIPDKPWWINQASAPSYPETAARICNDFNHGMSYWMYGESILPTPSPEPTSDLLGFQPYALPTDRHWLFHQAQYYCFAQFTAAFDIGAGVRFTRSNVDQDMPYGHGADQVCAVVAQNPDSTWAIGLINNNLSGQPLNITVAVQELAQTPRAAFNIWRMSAPDAPESDDPIYFKYGAATLSVAPQEFVTLRSMASVTNVVLQISGGGPQVIVSWQPTQGSGLEVTSDILDGDWSAIAGATNPPVTLPASRKAQYFRVR